ncbi:MAG TPA: hypothetical protein VIH47_02875 [Solirubrobacterales bacterium]
MRLVPASFKREALAAALVLALGALVCLGAAGVSSARPTHPSRTAVVPDGTYGVNVATRGEYIVFTVRNRRVSKLAFQIQILCQASDSPSAEPRFFSAAQAPQGRLIPSNGRLHLEWQERGDGRLGNIGVNLRFGTRDSADLNVIVPEEQGPEAMPDEAKETCDGGSILHFRRGYEVPPLPTTPSGAPAF